MSLKTTLRERWKQFEYEASLVKKLLGTRGCKYYAFTGEESLPRTNMPNVDGFHSWFSDSFNSVILNALPGGQDAYLHLRHG